MVDLSHCYLHTLGDEESAKLESLRSHIPAIAQKVRAESAEAANCSKLTIWRVDVEAKSDASDIVLLKFLRAEDLDVDKAAERVAQTLIFRADCRIDELAASELPEQFRGHDSVSGRDDDGRPVMISRFGNMDIDKVFGNTEMFVRYRAKIMEQAIGLLPFEKGTAEDLCQVHDYSGVLSSMYKTEVKSGVGAISKVFAEHYPEFKGKTIFMNFPAVFSGPFKAFAALLPERTRKKFIILGKDDHEALFEHVNPALIPAVLGGLLEDPPSKVSAPAKTLRIGRGGTEEVTLVEFSEAPRGATVRWELRVCTLEVKYQVVFVPAGGAPEEVIQASDPSQNLKAEDGVVGGEWTVSGPGKVMCRFVNDRAWFKSRLCVCRAELSA